MSPSNSKSSTLAPFLPETTTVGVLGSGQLGRMFAIAARRLGYNVHVYSPEKNTPAGQVADQEVVGDYNDEAALLAFARDIDVATLEFENIPSAALTLLEEHVPVRPGKHVLHTTQHRLREKTALNAAGFPVADFVSVTSLSELQNVSADRLPGILKTAAWGYDGKGQSRIDSPDDIAAAWAALGCDEAVLESFVDFQCELSVIAARSANGEVACYAPIRNDHQNHILDISFSPSGLPEAVTKGAERIAREIVTQFDVIGVLCVEMFLTQDQRLVINELAPRPHNSGHLTIDGHKTCQFEQQVRAVCGLPLGCTEQSRPAAMANLLGDLWQPARPNWYQVLRNPDLKLHLYGKSEPRIGRKMGHLTALASTAEQAAAKARHGRELLLEQNHNLEPAS